MQTSDKIAREAVARLPKGHFIDGAFAESDGGALMDSFDPGSGTVFARFANGTEADVNRAVESAHTALGPWSRMSAAARAGVLHKAASLLRAEAEQIAIIETLDCGKPISEALADVRGAARAFDYYAGAIDKLQGDTFPLPHGYLGYSIYEPVGVTAHIIPWNFPLATAARGIAPALAAGCTVIAKPAEQTPFSALLLAELLGRAGLPAGVCNLVTGTGANVGAPLVAHVGIDHITFTGSVTTGQHVMRSAADNVTRLTLELGGKSPVVVLDDCNEEAALDGVIGAIFENAGQICSAGSRLVIEKGVHDRFVEKLVARTKQLTLGHGLRDPQVGPLNSHQHLAKVAGFIDRARARGAEVLTGGTVTTDPQTGTGWFYMPTIVADRPRDDELVREEIFGPVLTIQVAEDKDHALGLANDCSFGLAAGVYTKDVTTALQMARDIDAGQVYINEYFAGGIEVPFGGNKLSGFGREKGFEGLKSYCKIKSVAARIS